MIGFIIGLAVGLTIYYIFDVKYIRPLFNKSGMYQGWDLCKKHYNIVANDGIEELVE